MADHLILGAQGEEIACNFLLENNYDIRERNVRFVHDELDVIAFDKTEQMIVFVEVKTRTKSSVTYPTEAAVGFAKRKRLRRAINQWMTKYDYDGPARIDILCVTKGSVEKHLKNIGSDFF